MLFATQIEGVGGKRKSYEILLEDCVLLNLLPNIPLESEKFGHDALHARDDESTAMAHPCASSEARTRVQRNV